MAKIKRTPEQERIAEAILRESGAETADDALEAIRGILGPVIESMLQAELDAHLGYPSNDKSPKGSANRRNGYTTKKVRSSAGEVEISVPRDRDATLRAGGRAEGQLRPLRHRGAGPVDVRAGHVAARHSRHRARDIRLLDQRRDGLGDHRQGVGGARAVEVAPARAGLRVRVRGLPVRAGQARAGRAQRRGLRHPRLRPGGAQGRAGAVDGRLRGRRALDGVFDEIRQRGVEDVLFVCMDGVSGLEEGLRAVFPDAVAQRCVVHMVRNSTKYVPQRDMQAFCRSVRAVYGAASLAEAQAAWEAFRAEWSRYPGAVGVWERNLPHVWQLFSYGSAVRKVMYTTNALESVNASFRKVREEGMLPRRGRGDEAALPEGQGALRQMGRGLPPVGLVPGAQPAAVRRGDQGEDREVQVMRLTQNS